MDLPSRVFLFAETFRLIVRHRMKESFTFSFRIYFYDLKRHHDRIDQIFRSFKKKLVQWPKKNQQPWVVSLTSITDYTGKHASQLN